MGSLSDISFTSPPHSHKNLVTPRNSRNSTFNFQLEECSNPNNTDNNNKL